MAAKIKARMSGIKPAKPAAGTYLLGCKENVRLMSFTQIEGEIGSSSNINLAFKNSLSPSGSIRRTSTAGTSAAKHSQAKQAMIASTSVTGNHTQVLHWHSSR